MKQIFFQSFFPAVLIPAFFSCELEPPSENFRDMAKPDTTQTIQVNLSPFETQYVFTKTVNVHYDLNTFGLKIYNFDFFFVGDNSMYNVSRIYLENR